MKECGDCYEPGYNGPVCLCIRVAGLFKDLNRLLDGLMGSPVFAFVMGFAAATLFWIWLSSTFDNKEKSKNDG